MKKILICATLPQRFLDQVIFAKNIANETDDLDIRFYVSDDVYSMHSQDVDNLEFTIINKINRTYQSKNQYSTFNAIKYRIKKSLSNNQLRFIRSCINFFRNFFIYKKIL